MGRPIDEDDVIKIIRMLPPEDGTAPMVVQSIKQLPSAQPEISCSEIPNSSDLISTLSEAIKSLSERAGGDTISRQAALDCFHGWVDWHGNVHSADEMAEYKAIEHLPSAQPSGKDPIEREAVVDILHDAMQNCSESEENLIGEIVCKVDLLPSAEPKRGKWEITNLGAVGAFDSCSECKRVVKHKAPFYNYCPNCGADMRGEQDG